MKDYISLKKLVIILGCLAFISLVFFACYFQDGSSSIERAEFIVTTISLVVLLIYVIDTNRIANTGRITQLSPIISHQFEVQKRVLNIEGYNEVETEVFLEFSNYSIYDAKLQVFLEIIVEGRVLKHHVHEVDVAYSGKKYWFVGAKNAYQGHFSFGASFLLNNDVAPDLMESFDWDCFAQKKVQFKLCYIAFNNFFKEGIQSMDFIYDFRVVESEQNDDREWQVMLVPVVYEVE